MCVCGGGALCRSVTVTSVCVVRVCACKPERILSISSFSASCKPSFLPLFVCSLYLSIAIYFFLSIFLPSAEITAFQLVAKPRASLDSVWVSVCVRAGACVRSLECGQQIACRGWTSSAPGV